MGILEPRGGRAPQDGVSATMATYHKKGLKDLEPASRRVLMRVDFNVPVKDGAVSDETRIAAAMPSLRYLLGKSARVVLMSHLGRPKGAPDPRYTLKPVAERLE